MIKLSARTKKLIIGFLLFFLIVLLFYVFKIAKKQVSFLPSPTPTQTSLASTPTTTLNRTKVKVVVVKVIDGDTVVIEGGQRLRYIGIDAAEITDRSKPIPCFAEEAAKKNKELVEGKIVELEKDISETDRWGRLLRYVYINGLFINDYLVRQGYAYSWTYPPDVKYQSQFIEAEKEARDNNRGLWANCSK